MNLKFYATLLALLPFVAIAQPTVTGREQYPDNSIVTYVYSYSNLEAGNAGANQTWDFSSLVLSNQTGDTLQENIIVPNGSGPYINYKQVEKFSDSTITYIKSAGTNQGIAFSADSSTPPSSITYAHPLVNQIYSMSLGASVADTASFNFDDQGFGYSGIGNTHISLVVDGYGTLKLPWGTYNNTVRLKEIRIDSINYSSIIIVDTDILYRWYNASFFSPLLNLDSSSTYVPGIGSSPYNYIYTLLTEHVSTGVDQITVNRVAFNVHLDNETLGLAGSFAAGTQYNVCIFNMEGQKICDNDFAGGKQYVSLPLQHNLPSGTYTVVLMEKNKPETLNTVKTVKM